MRSMSSTRSTRSTRSIKSNKNQKLDLDNTVEYLDFFSYLNNLPKKLTERLFKIFSKNSDSILKNDFLTGMINLFSGDEYLLLKLFYDLLFPDQEVVDLENLKQIFRMILNFEGEFFEKINSKIKSSELIQETSEQTFNYSHTGKLGYLEFLEVFQNSYYLRTFFFQVKKC